VATVAGFLGSWLVFGHTGKLVDHLWLTAGVVSWALFTFGDSIQLLVDDERGLVVRNSAAGVIRVLLLPIAAPFGPLAFLMALTAAGVFGTFLTTHVFLPRAIAGYRARPMLTLVGARQVLAFSLGSYLAALVGGAAALMMPILVHAIAGPIQTAYFSVAWVIASVVSLAPSALSVSVFVHASRNESVPWIHLWVGVVCTGAIATMAVATAALWRPVAYSILGPQYQAGMASAGDLLLLSALPVAINSALTAALRYLKALRSLTVAAVVATGSVALACAALVDSMGVKGAAIAWLLGQASGSVAFVLLTIRAVGAANATVSSS
jgi:O-antigen/teichoic acid export membrane protein